MDFRIIIPARYQSSRLPGKPLIDIAGKPMIQHVYEKAKQTSATSIVVATDDQRIATVAKKFGADVCMTRVDHLTGSDRLSEVVTLLNYGPQDIIVNVQGDEPMIPPELIKQVANNLTIHESASMATLCEAIHDLDKLQNPNIVKVVMDIKGFALYFSRSVIPWVKEIDLHSPYQTYYRHIGLYAYRASFLQRYNNMTACPIELSESLEQLRMLWYGEKIHVEVACKKPEQDVNTEEDLIKVRNLIEAFDKA
jgi:3-deoxy-manno-octulosonate cytidylyltransferase (CMP-KDO synthetase)